MTSFAFAVMNGSAVGSLAGFAIALDYGNHAVRAAYNDAYVIGLSNVVTDARILPVIKNDIAGRGNIRIIFHPSAEVLIEPDHARAAALGRHYVSQSALQGYGRHERCAPRPR